MNKDQRQRKLNLAADAIFSGGITEDDYEAIKEAANYRPCPHCGDSFRWTLAFSQGPMTRLGDKYCKKSCAEAAEREHAPMIKPQDKPIHNDPALIGWI